jgi:hypothetical protein
MNITSAAKQYFKALLLVLSGMVWFSSVAHATPNPPGDVVVVPRYAATLSLVVSWNDNSADETGFEIQRRAQGDVAWSPLVPPAIVGASVTNYEDNTATSDRMWEYQVRALGVAGDDSVWVGPSNTNSPRIDWPVDDGSHNILHNYGNPLDNPDGSGALYYHDGIDFANNGQINAARGGRIADIFTDDNGGMYIDVDTGAAQTHRDVYWHLRGRDLAFDVTDKNDSIAPGEALATSLYDFVGYGPDANHMHWETQLVGPGGIGLGGKISVLSLFISNADKDPQTNAPVVADVNDDGDDFIVVDAAANNHSSPREPAWGDVDFLVDAYDDMSVPTDLVVSPQSIGYWIQPGRPGAESVASRAMPYRLISFEKALNLCGSPCRSEAIAENALYDGLPAEMHGVSSWQSYYTWVVTNTLGTDGDPANIDATQFWRSDARSGTGAEENGSDADHAREIQEARFPDGTYFVHVLLGDLVHDQEYLRSVLVDNWRPYVRAVRVLSGPRLVYKTEWLWHGGTAQLAAHPPTFDEAAAFTALRTQDLTIEVEFSEPMQSASITDIVPQGGAGDLGAGIILSPKTTAAQVWTGVIANGLIDDGGAHDGAHFLHIAGRDLAGNDLLEIDSRAAIGANHHNRDATGVLRGTAGEDSIHGFRIGPLGGELTVAAIFMKQRADDPGDVTKEELGARIEACLDAYFPTVSYDAVEGFVVNPYGWFRLDHPLDWYETDERTPLIDLVQEAIAAAEVDGAPIPSTDYVLVVTDETDPREEWSAGPWPYAIDADPGMRLIAAGTANRASVETAPRLTNTMARMLGLIDLFAYPEVPPIGRPFVGPWSHMSDKLHGVHVLGWEKWRAGWIDETGTSTGNTVERVLAPGVGTPIEDSRFILHPLNTDSNGLKVLAVEVAEGLHFTAEYRRQEQLDADLPDEGVPGVLITRANDLVNQGEGPVIVQESSVTAGDLGDAPFTTTAPRNQFEDLGSGVRIEVLSITPDEAEVRLDYSLPDTENDVFVAQHDEHWRSEDIWIDAPDLEGHYAADPLSVRAANELPVVGALNRVYGRVRNQGHADALDVTIHLEIREPWGAGGPWRELSSRKTVPLLQGQDTNPGAHELIMGEWMPSGDPHACVKLWTDAVDRDDQPGNNWTQQNFTDFDSVSGSPYSPVTSRFGVENPFDEPALVLFRVDGLPKRWTYSVTPKRLSLPAHGVGDALVTIQPDNDSQVCSREQITLTAYTPRVDTLKRLGGITLQITLKNPASVTAESSVDCRRRDTMKGTYLTADHMPAAWTDPQRCVVLTQGCTDPALPNTQVAVVYTAPDGTREVRYVTTDEHGCYVNTLTIPDSGTWDVQAIIEPTDCRVGDGSPVETIDVRQPDPGFCAGGGICCFRWLAALVAFAGGLLLLARYRCDLIRTPVWGFVALAVAAVLMRLLLSTCPVELCWLLLGLAIALLFVAFVLCRTRWAPCICGRGKAI